MKHTLCLVLFAFTSVLHAQAPVARPLVLPPDSDLDQVRELGRAAITEVMEKFGQAQGGGGMTSFLVMPLRRDVDGGYLSTQFENAFTQKAAAAGYKLYTGRDEAIAQLLSRTVWTQTNEDMVDPATIQELGKVVDAQAIVIPRVDVSRRTDGTLSVRANMQVYERETFRLHWGDESVQLAKPPLSREDLLLWVGLAVAVLGVLFVLGALVRAFKRRVRPR